MDINDCKAVDINNVKTSISSEKIYRGCVKVSAVEIGEMVIGPKNEVEMWIGKTLLTFERQEFISEIMTDEERALVDDMLDEMEG